VRGHAPPVDFCNRYDPRARPRTTEPRMTSPAVARRCSRSHDRDLSIVALSCGWLRCPFGNAASRDVMGQGLRRGQLASARHLPTRSLARELRPNPFGSDTSCRGSRRAQAGVACVAEDSFRFLLARARLASIRFRDLRLPVIRFLAVAGSVDRAASRAPPRRGTRSAAPEVPSIAG
jgi:hypothetical protein